MVTLENLEGLAVKKIDAEFFSKASQIKAILDKGIAATAAEQNGALNIWKADDGRYRCESMRSFKTLDYQKFTTLGQVGKWAKEWLELIK